MFGTCRRRDAGIFLNCVIVAALGLTASAEAAKRFDKDLQKQMVSFTKDREEAFSGSEADTKEQAEARWTELAGMLDSLYLGEEITIATYGSGATTRQTLTHFVFTGLEAQRRNHELTPPPEKLVAGHPILQELVIRGTLYTRGETYPKKMKDLLAARPEFLALIRLHLDSWDEKLRAEFEETYPVEEE